MSIYFWNPNRNYRFVRVVQDLFNDIGMHRILCGLMLFFEFIHNSHYSLNSTGAQTLGYMSVYRPTGSFHLQCGMFFTCIYIYIYILLSLKQCGCFEKMKKTKLNCDINLDGDAICVTKPLRISRRSIKINARFLSGLLQQVKQRNQMNQ